MIKWLRGIEVSAQPVETLLAYHVWKTVRKDHSI